MLIRFAVQNFRSFYEEAVFSMLPGRMQKHAHHIISAEGAQGIDVLRTGLLYGANASGKSNLIKAMDFARDFILDGTKPKQRIRVEPFRLKKEAWQQPSRFEFEFVSNGQAYAYGFVVDRHRVHEEWLYLMDKQKEVALFERTADSETQAVISFPNPKLLPTQDEQFLQFVARSTRPNQLFLTKSTEDNLPDFAPVFDWFNENLIILFPDSQITNFPGFVQNDKGARDSLSKFLTAMNTGIVAVTLDRVDKSHIPFPTDELFDKLEPQDSIIVDVPPEGIRYIAGLDEKGQPEVYSLGAVHHLGNGGEVTFDVFEESDGTQRLFDLFPVLHSAEPGVFVIDELERSLHPNLVRRFIEWFLESDSKSQLIVSTHESTLLDLELLRRDEIWFVEKSPAGSSTLYSLEEFKPRADLDIRRGYLHGRFGAIPVLGSSLKL